MKKILTFILLLLFCLFTLTGCYNTLDIDNIFYILALGIDEDSENENLIKISVQIANSTSSSDTETSSSNDYKIYSVECEDLIMGINILNNYLSKKINLSHCNAIVISEAIAKKGLHEYITTLSNNTEIRPSSELFISSTTAYDLLDNVANSSESFSTRLYDSLTSSANYTAFTTQSTFNDFFNKINDTDTSLSATYAVVSNSTVQSNGIAVFSGGKMIGTLDVFDTIAHLIIKNDLESCILSFENPLDTTTQVDTEINLYKNTEVNITLINNTPFITIEIFPEGSILSSGENYNYTDSENIELVENALNNYVENLARTYLYKITKDYNTDITRIFSNILFKFCNKR